MLTRRLLCVAVLLLAANSPVVAQIAWNVTYLDTAGNGNQFGFNDTGTDAGETLSRGLLRRNSVTAATDYLSRYLDGRGTINAQFGTSRNEASGSLASYGPQQLINAPGTFQNGGMYQAARTNTHPFAGVDGSGDFNFGYGWNYAGQTNAVSTSRFDMVTVGIHEIMHGLGFLSFASQSGQGLLGNLGTPDIYSGMERWLQRGNGAFNATSRLFNTDITDSGYGSFTGNASTFTNLNNTTTGLFFGGPLAREVFGGAVPMYAPNPYEDGSSVSHVNNSVAVMNPSVTPNTVKRFRPYEVAMMMDAGWNVYNWNETTGGTANWSTGSTNVALSRWRSDSGVVNVSGTSYNRFSAQNPAPVLPVYGQVTSNIILNFRNTGATAYTSTNDFGTGVRLSRLTFSSTNAAGGITIASTAGGFLNFGQNADLSPSVLVPKIIQNGVGAVTISSAIQVNNIATQNVDGVPFAGHSGVTVEGTGSGAVTLSGAISGDGGITKNSSTFNLIYANTAAGTYTGTTTVNAGGLYVNGSLNSTTNGVTVNGGTLGGTGTINRAVTVNSGGVIEAGSAPSTLGTLGVKAATTVNSGGNLRAELGTGTASDRLDMTGGSHALDLKNGSFVALSANGFTRATTTYTLADLDSATATLLKVEGANVAAGTVITTFTFAGVGVDGNVNSVGNVDLTLSNFTAGSALVNGDRFVLRRDTTSGDLVLTFTPVPEPAGVLLLCGLAAAGGLAWRRWKASRVGVHASA